MLNFHQSLPFLNSLFSLLLVPQEFPARNSYKIFPQDFSELYPDWLAPHHPIVNAKFPPITTCHKKPFSLLLVLQEFPIRNSRKIFPNCILIGWLPITLFKMLNCNQSLPFLNTIFYLLLVPQEFPVRFSRAVFWLVCYPSPYSKC